MNVYYRLATLISKPHVDKPLCDYPDVDPTAFGFADRSVISIRGVNYVPQKITRRVRLHNWLIDLGNRQSKFVHDCSCGVMQ